MVATSAPRFAFREGIPMWRLVSSVVIVLIVNGSALAAVVDVVTCDQEIPDRATGVVQRDLTCPAGQALSLGSGATLDLAGRSVTGLGGGIVIDVDSPGRHTIKGPGQLVNVTVSCGAGFSYRRDLRLTSVSIVPTSFAGCQCEGGNPEPNRITVRDVQITGPSSFGLIGQRVRATRLTIAGSTDMALLADDLRATDVSIVGTGGRAVWATGGLPQRVALRRADIRDNAGAGVSGVRVSVRRSTVTGNGLGEPGFEWDIGTSEQPRVASTTCDRSRRYGSASTWEVCALD